MGEAIAHVLPPALGVALSPIPIIAIILMRAPKRASLNGIAFVAGCLAGLVLVGVIVFMIAGRQVGDTQLVPPTLINAIELVIGGFLSCVALEQWRARPAKGREPVNPRWLNALDELSALKACAIAALLSGLNPKNSLLAIGAASTLADSAVPAGTQAIAYAIFATLATGGVALPLALYF